MAKIKTVYPTDMVCHLWANRHPHAIRNASGNVSAACGRIYSYGHHFVMGAFLDNPEKGGANLLLWCTASYGNATSKHQSHASGALSQAQRSHESFRLVPFQFSESDLSTRSGLPGMAKGMQSAAADQLAKAQTAVKYFAHHYGMARDYLKTAEMIFLYIGDKKAARAVPALDSTVDTASRTAVKADAARVEKAIKAGAWFVEAGAMLQRAKREKEITDSHIETFKRDAVNTFMTARIILQNVNDTKNLTEKAAHLYQKAGKKPAPDCARILAFCKVAGLEWAPLAHIEECEAARKEFEKRMNNARIHLAWARRYKGDTFILASGRVTDTTRAALDYAIGDSFRWDISEQQARAMYGEKGKQSAIDTYHSLKATYKRIATAEQLKRNIDRVRDTIAVYENSTNPYASIPADSLSPAIAAYLTARGFESHENALPAYYVNQCAPLVARIAELKAAHAEKVRAANAAKIEAWRAGERVTMSHEVPTMARIAHGMVETSRGASVPLEHAARLVRLARIAAARGGQEWAHGTGPIVGHFRLERVGADMSARIGCHDFDSVESHRIAALIEAACVVAEESTNG